MVKAKKVMKKADFIRQYPAASRETIATLAKKKGMVITPQYVTEIRSSDKKAAARSADAVRSSLNAKKRANRDKSLDVTNEDARKRPSLVPDMQAPPAPSPASEVVSLEKSFMMLVLRLGTARSKDLLTLVDKRLSTLLSGDGS